MATTGLSPAAGREGATSFEIVLDLGANGGVRVDLDDGSLVLRDIAVAELSPRC